MTPFFKVRYIGGSKDGDSRLVVQPCVSQAFPNGEVYVRTSGELTTQPVVMTLQSLVKENV